MESKNKWEEDSDIIFTAISTSSARDFKEAESMVVAFYVTDMSFTRSGISNALKRLKEYYDKR